MSQRSVSRGFILFLLLGVLVSMAYAQSRAPRRRIPVKKKVVATNLRAFTEKEWNSILVAVDQENWMEVTKLSSAAFLKLKNENSRRHLARLRYIFLFANAGLVAQGALTTTQLKLIADSFAGKILIAPRRTILFDCEKRLNFICRVNGDSKTLRVTATNKDASVIHFFEYFDLPTEFDAQRNDRKEAFLGGSLFSFEINQNLKKDWIIRLNFSDGFLLSSVED